MLENSPVEVLAKYWSYDSFRKPQAEIINQILAGENVIGLLPTGAGKSICFQVPGIMREGFTLVISPLVALMEDQVYQLKKRGIKAEFLHSAMHKSDIDRVLDNVIYGDYQFLYVSPERILTEFFQARAHKMNLSLIAIDEAHCISQWGHDFRPSYLRLAELQGIFPNIPIAAFTATATKNTLKDIKEYLGIDSSSVFRKSFAKENLSYTVIKTAYKIRELLYVLGRVKGSGIIYVRSRRITEELTKELTLHGYSVDFYHAGLSYKRRKAKQEKWLQGQTKIMISTNAFGMGIDKSDVRWVIHMDIPPSIEEYYQEAGRAGRDGEKSHAIMIYDEKDESNSYEQLELSQVNNKDVNQIYDLICRYLRIPIGGGFLEAFAFDISDFSKGHKIALKKVLAVISQLELAGIVITTDSIYSPSTLMLKSSREQQYGSNETNTEFQQFLLSLARNYEGLFTHYVKIGEEKIARFSKLSISKVNKYLKSIHELGIGIYQERSELPQLIFQTNRVEARSLAVDYVKLNKLYENRWEKQEAIMSFLTSQSCRERNILRYFDEKSTKNCGRCDVCKGSLKEDFKQQELQELTAYLKKKITIGVDLFDVLHWWPHNRRKKVMAMSALLENEKVISLKGRKIAFL